MPVPTAAAPVIAQYAAAPGFVRYATDAAAYLSRHTVKAAMIGWFATAAKETGVAPIAKAEYAQAAAARGIFN